MTFQVTFGKCFAYYSSELRPDEVPTNSTAYLGEKINRRVLPETLVSDFEVLELLQKTASL